ncbi:MAG: Bug family tripartite tricarboxylate transporter substrate binding protein, partial [Candidatus Binatia bacterium]
MKKIVSFFTWLSILAFFASTTLAADAKAPFFDGKTFRIIVSASPGGGYDAYARLFARHMKEHLPGEQEIIVQNMPGGGGIRAANYLSKVADPDGLTWAHLSRGVYLSQFTGQAGVEFDITKFIPLGSATFENQVVFVRSDLLPGSLQKLTEASAGEKKIFVGSTGLGSSTFVLWKTLEALVPELKYEFVSGYPGSTEIHLALRQGEVNAYAQSESSFLLQAKELLKTGKIAVIAQIGTSERKRDSDFPDAPTFWELVDSKKDKSLVSVAAASSFGGRPFFLPPGVPSGRVEVLRSSFVSAAKDPDLLAEAEKLKRPVDPVPGPVLEEIYRDVFDASPE